MGPRLNIVVIVVDSLRYDALHRREHTAPLLPYFTQLAHQAATFHSAYATECWTLPTHMSIFTGLLPSEHGAHFGDLAYRKGAPTIAEILTSEGYRTELITRNPILDGTLPGVTRGFTRNTQVLSTISGLNPLSLMLAATKPRFRRQVRSSGFFHPLQRESRAFITAFARATVPADREALACVLDRMRAARRDRQPCFLFANLFDVHAPYPPAPRSIFRSPFSRNGLLDFVMMPWVLPKLGSHRYLEPGFRMSPLAQRLLRQRYADAVVLADQKLAEFHAAAKNEGLLDDTLLVVTSDHGEAFGEHDLYLHDASVYDTHLHVPLYIVHPDIEPFVTDDVVTTRDLFGLLQAVGLGTTLKDTILDPGYRAARPIAFAEHTPYPHLANVHPRYTKRLAAAVTAGQKIILRGGDAEVYNLSSDPAEQRPEAASIEEFARSCSTSNVPRAAAENAASLLSTWKALAA